MSDWIQWILAALFALAVIIGSVLVSVATKPECPQLSEARWTRSGGMVLHS